MARMTPASPPWKDMPPSQSAEEGERIVEEMAGLVEERVAEAAAEDDADDEPEQEVVDVGARERRRLGRPTAARSTTSRRAYHQPSRMPAK